MDDGFISKSMSKRIMETAHNQALEVRMETEELAPVSGGAELDASELLSFKVTEEGGDDFDGGDFAAEYDIDDDDEAALRLFMNMTGGGGARVNLADLIMEKMKEAEEVRSPEYVNVIFGITYSNIVVINPKMKHLSSSHARLSVCVG